MPLTPGEGSYRATMRSIQYDTFSERYGRHILDEVISDASRAVRPLQNILLANALKGRGYDFYFRHGEGFHSGGQAALDLPESLTWLWREYDPERTGQVFDQDSEERAEPVYRVRVANR